MFGLWMLSKVQLNLTVSANWMSSVCVCVCVHRYRTQLQDYTSLTHTQIHTSHTDKPTRPSAGQHTAVYVWSKCKNPWQIFTVVAFGYLSRAKLSKVKHNSNNRLTRGLLSWPRWWMFGVMVIQSSIEPTEICSLKQRLAWNCVASVLLLGSSASQWITGNLAWNVHKTWL